MMKNKLVSINFYLPIGLHYSVIQMAIYLFRCLSIIDTSFWEKIPPGAHSCKRPGINIFTLKFN